MIDDSQWPLWKAKRSLWRQKRKETLYLYELLHLISRATKSLHWRSLRSFSLTISSSSAPSRDWGISSPVSKSGMYKHRLEVGGCFRAKIWYIDLKSQGKFSLSSHITAVQAGVAAGFAHFLHELVHPAPGQEKALPIMRTPETISIMRTPEITCERRGWIHAVLILVIIDNRGI